MTIPRNASGPMVALKLSQPAAIPSTGGAGAIGRGVWSVLSMGFGPFFAVVAKSHPRIRQYPAPPSHLCERG